MEGRLQTVVQPDDAIHATRSGIGKMTRPVRNRVTLLPLPPGGLLLDPDDREDA